MPKCAEVIRTDKEREVVVSCLDAYQELLKEVGSPVLEGEGHADAIIYCVKDVLNSRVYYITYNLLLIDLMTDMVSWCLIDDTKIVKRSIKQDIS